MGKRYYKFILVLFFCFSANSFCFAQEENENILKSTSQQLESNIPKNVNLEIGEIKHPLASSEIISWIDESAELSYNPSLASEIENTNFCQYKHLFFCSLSFSYRKEGYIKKDSTLKINRESIKKFVEELAQETDEDPQNAKIKVENGKASVFSLSGNGTKLKQEESAKILFNYVQEEKYADSLKLPVEEIDPEITTDSIDNMGITDLLAEGRSNFRGSPKNRVFNIKVATSRFDGVFIKPKEEFSFVKILGEVDGEHGYLPELVIKKDKTEPEFGGGICQVSTTAFRAALKSGLEITARRNHAYPVQYYNPQGMDATVYVPRPDLRFINNTSGYILIQTRIEGTELIFSFFGANDGRKVEIEGPKIIERKPDGSMKTTLTQRVTDKDGKVIIEDVFNSSYDSPSKYPHPGTTGGVLTKKPKDWSDKEWREYKKANGA